jgi:hypothetical protein
MPRLSNVRSRTLSTRFLMQVAVMALDRWDRLSQAEQDRFRTLARRNGDGRNPLAREEQKELKVLWRKLEPLKLLGDAARMRRTGEQPDR